MASHHFRKRWGAEPSGDGAWAFSLWAPDAQHVSLDLGDETIGMVAARDGWHRVEAAARPGDSYAFRIGGTAYPDPAARAQTGDVHGRSLLADPRAYGWRSDWPGIPWSRAVVYELHVGTFTEQGTFDAAREELPRLKALGITLIEIMPVAQFDGAHGWGYDGVLPYTPHRAYGAPDDLKRLIDAAHGLGIGVILDVVYNHLGPSGNYLAAWCPSFFHPDRTSPWGQGIAYEQEAVRGYFLDNALYWLEEYRLDGLRLDAVHAIEDHSAVHILDELGALVRDRIRDRPIHLITEDERNLSRYFAAPAPFDATWNDDWHHAVHCLLTGEDESYYASFAVDPLGDIETALRDGYVEQGQARAGLTNPRGEPSATLPRTAFVNFIGNHDQVGNRAQGERLHQLVADRAALRVVTALTLLSPFVPMIFMGDEFLTDAPFLFFADFTGDLAEAVRKGRTQEFAQFTAFGGDVPDPISPKTFERSKIGAARTDAQHAHEAFVARLLALRAQHVAPLLAQTASPRASVQRCSATIDATWDFGADSLLLRCRLGAGDFAPHDDALFVEADDSVALSFTMRRG